MDVHAKYREEVHDCRLAAGRDFQKAAAACLDVAVRWGVWVRRYARERFLARQPQAALQKVVCSREPRPRVEPVRLRAVGRELQDE